MRLIQSGLCFGALLGALSAQTPSPSDPATAVSKQDSQTPTTDVKPKVGYIGPIKFSGIMDVYGNYSYNHPSNNLTAYHAFDTKASGVSLNMARFTLEHDADPIGFRLDMGWGDGYDAFHITEKDTVWPIANHMMQFYASYKPKWGKGLQLDFGKFYTSAGAEVTESHLNWNYSRSLLFALGPYYHFGFRSTMPLGKGFTAGFQVVNGWNNINDLNGGKTLGFTGSWSGKWITISDAFYVGPEKIGTTEGYRKFNDTVVAITPSSRVSAYLNYDVGSEGKVGGGSSAWYGIGTAVRIQLTKRFAIAPRYDYFVDSDGLMSGTRQHLKSVTGTVEYRITDWMVSRAEWRKDLSDMVVFPYRNNIPGSRQQNQLIFGLMAYWAPKN